MTVPDPDRPRWHVLQTRATTPHTFAISPPEWRDRRLTLAASLEAGDDEQRIYGRASKQWLAWLRAGLESGRINAAELQAVSNRFAAGVLSGDAQAEEPASAAWAAMRFRRKFPSLMVEFAAEALDVRQAKILLDSWEIIDFAREFVSGPSGWDEREPMLGRGDWPDDVAVVQVADGRRWGPVTSYGAHHGFHPPLADERFLGALRAAGAVAGWHAGPVDVRDRDWDPVTTHQAVFVDERIWLGSLMEPLDHSGSGYWGYAYVEPEVDDAAAILRGDHGLYLSQAAADALSARKLSGFDLVPLRYADEVPGSERGFPGP